MRLLALGLVLALAGSAAAARPPAGRVAFVQDHRLVLLDLASGTSRVLVRAGVNPPVRFSADGRYLAYGAGETWVLPVARPGLRTSLPAHAWAWSPHGHSLAIAQHDGSAAVADPAGATQLVAPAGWAPSSFAWSPNGATLALGRLDPPEVWVSRDGRLARIAGPFPGTQAPELAAVANDGRTVFWWRRPHSTSTAADGLPLTTVDGGLPTTLLYHDWLAWCRGRLYVTAGSDRYATHGKRIVAVAPPAWRPRDVSRDARLSWVAPACTSGGRIVASAGQNRVEPRFGRERRSLFVLSPRRRLTRPPVDATDESPRAAGDALLFVRVRGFVARMELLRGGRVRELAILGRSIGYYGHYDWAGSFDWTR